MACEGSSLVKVNCLPFLLVFGWTFVLTKSCISSTHEFIRVICSINCKIALRIVKLACKVAIASAGQTMTVYDSRRIVDIVADHYMMEDRVDHRSS